MYLLSGLGSKPTVEESNTVKFVDSRGLSLDLRDSLPSPSSHSEILKARIRQILRKYMQERGGFPKSYYQEPNLLLYCNDFRWDLDGQKVEAPIRQKALEDLCTDLGAIASDPQDHLSNMEQRLSKHLLCIIKSNIPEDIIIDRTTQILERLPPSVVRVDFHVDGKPSSLASWPKDYLNLTAPPVYMMHSTTAPWQELSIVSYMSTAVIILGIHVVIANRGARNVAWVMQSRLNFISELIDQVEAASPGQKGLSDYGKYVLLAYLWTDWQRSVMLLMYYILGNELMHGYNIMWSDLLALRGNSILARAGSSSVCSFDGSFNRMSNYICPWAFGMLKANRSSVGLDFRTFHRRFAAVHGHQSARCLFGSGNACDGSHPLTCGRFADKRLVAAEQSMHDRTCSGRCDRLIWDEKSYRSISGGRAVLINRKAKYIAYCKADELTMAISHVWSHGQGGRPKTGINRCLHHRYCRIARLYGCQSYWIDAVCIPEAHDLRNEAIRYINSTFTNAHITLVCDKDLMSIDITNAKTDVKLLESIISTFLVCDWSVRAWTLLEAFRGNHNTHLLCKDNEIISLRQTWARVYLEGNVDLAILSLAARHFLPSSSDGFRNSQYRRGIEYAGSLLSHRHATRAGDDIVIWTLMSDLQISDTAETMWKRRIKRKIKTGYLMTRTERLSDVRGFSWAPSSPYIRQPNSQAGESPGPLFLSFDGEGSEEGRITTKGLQGIWLVYDFDVKDVGSERNALVNFHSAGKERQNWCWQTAKELHKQQKRVRLIQPKSISGAEPYRASKDRGEIHGPLLAVCTAVGDCDVDNISWHWYDVYEWPLLVPLPEFALDEMLLV